MKKSFFLPLSFILIFISCDKTPLPPPPPPENPEVKDYMKSDFKVLVSEKRCTKTFDFSINENGEVSGIGHGETALTVTAWNTMIINVKAVDKNFNGANIESSDTKIVYAERLTDSTYRLKYGTDGNVKISVYNPLKKIILNVEAKEQIPIEGLLLRLGNKERLLRFEKRSYKELLNPDNMPERITDRMAVGKEKDQLTEDGYYVPDTTWVQKGFLFEIVGIVPENTSWRNISYYMAKGEPLDTEEPFHDDRFLIKWSYKNIQERMCPNLNWFPDYEKINLIACAGTYKDISYLTGRRQWAYNSYFMLEVKILKESMREVVITGNEDFYIMRYYLELENLL